MRIELTSYDAIELTSKELIQSIQNNVFGECITDDDYIVSGIVKLLKKTLLNNVDGEDYVIDFINWNITTTGDGFCDMLTTENNFTDEQREIIRNSDAVDAYIDAQKLEIFCDLLNGINAGEENYIRIFEGEDWEEIAREIISE